MCEQCDRPDLTMQEHLDELRGRLASRPFLVVAVAGSPVTAELAYTVGLTVHGLPELVVLGVRAEPAHDLLTAWAQYVLDESVVLPGEAMTWGPWVLEAVEVEGAADHLALAAALYGDAVRGLQLVWCDSAGRWPWEPGHRAGRAGQPVLGARAPWFCDEHRPDRLDVPRHP